MNKKNILVSVLIISILCVQFTACKRCGENKRKKAGDEKVEVARDTVLKDSVLVSNEQKVMTVLYQQRSGEFRGLCYQAFELAKLLLMRDLKDDKVISKRAIVVDIDETVLDNSPFEARCILENIQYPDAWDEWCQLKKAKPLPGAVDFLNLVNYYGVDVFYVSNRAEKLRMVTSENLKTAGFPLKDDDHLLLKQEESSKENRRRLIEERYHIVLFMGDNLNDFSGVFEKRTAGDRMQAVDSLKASFGTRFILLPNAMYGDWENALLNYNYTLNDREKGTVRKKQLLGF